MVEIKKQHAEYTVVVKYTYTTGGIPDWKRERPNVAPLSFQYIQFVIVVRQHHSFIENIFIWRVIRGCSHFKEYRFVNNAKGDN